jgi:hypothetical protein
MSVLDLCSLSSFLVASNSHFRIHRNAQIERQIDVLNHDYAGTGLSFVLADVDRIISPLYFDSVDKGNALEATMKGIDRRGGAADLNVWTVRCVSWSVLILVVHHYQKQTL